MTATDDQGFDREALSHMIQVAAPVEPGDSGGALVDAHSHVVGLITAAAAGGAQLNGGSGFAIPIDRALSVVDQMQAGRSSATVRSGRPTSSTPRSTQGARAMW